MSPTRARRTLDPTPPRPDRPLDVPVPSITATVRVSAAHIANPLVAVARLLASEAGAVARVTGDEQAFEVTVALPDDRDETRTDAQAWMRWAIHNAGVRGEIHWYHDREPERAPDRAAERAGEPAAGRLGGARRRTLPGPVPPALASLRRTERWPSPVEGAPLLRE
jgi:hypothetical protein